MDSICGELQRAARKHMEDMAWTNEKREGGGEMIDLLIRAFLIRIYMKKELKQWSKPRGCINTLMAQLVEIALEEGCAIKSERFRRNYPDKWLSFACFVYNTTPHTMTKYTPYEILFGRKANIPGNLQQRPVPLYNYDDLIHDIKKKLQECHEIARSNLIQTKQERTENQRDKFHMPVFREGDAVLLKK
jgi:hypothetical protein